MLTGLDTRSGQELGSVPVPLGDQQDGSTVSIRAVTNDGRVIAQGTKTSLMWLPLAGNDTVDLSVTAPEQQFLGASPIGVIVTDGAGGVIDGTTGEPYLAEISDAGELTRIGAVPTHDDIAISSDGTWLIFTAPGSTGGEVTSIPTLEVQRVDGTQPATLSAPKGWGFRVREWVWEDDDHLVSPVIRDADGSERMARCSTQRPRCVLIQTR